ncbi:helix-turn-helix transcriptional regulator [Sphingomonas sp. HMP9]|uniref:helix-turn-helix transcriptional regulator n=1 Tax=Sphingomonas sp. HMP9 TaxID=1517554 RepID=UPI001E3512DD|nr:WYL domain-containing protein [Sphingomonas sp. HMP9]
MTDEVRKLIDLAEQAVESLHILSFDYEDQHGAKTHRRAHPLGLWFWGKVWTLVAWCETRDDFRMFRLDRATGMAITGDRFIPVAARSLTECLRLHGAEYGSQD